MFNCPYFYNPYMMRQFPSSYIRVAHTLPNAPAVDVYANGNLIARNLRYREFTPYINIASGRYNIKVFPTGTTLNPVVNTNITLERNTIYTAAAIGKLHNSELLLITDPKIPMSQNKANVRFIHLSPDAPAIDITLPDGKVLFSNIGYKGITNYIQIDQGKYTLQARLAGTNTVVLNVPNISVRGNRNITVYAIGLAQGSPGLQVLIPLDGSTYI